MKRLFSFDFYVLSLVGLTLVLTLFVLTQSQNRAKSYVYSYDLDPALKGQVKAATTESSTTFTEINPKDVFDLLKNSDTILIDVSAVYKTGHIPGAINIPLKDIDTMSLSMDKNKTYIVYCHNNTDSLLAIQKLVNLGFEKLYRISGGYKSWVDAKYKIEK